MKKIIYSLIVIIPLLVSSCMSYTRSSLYGKVYEEKPVTLLVMPPINNTTNVEAKDLLYTSINKPLIEAGYYVISPHLSLEILKNESAYDAEQFVDNDVSIFGKVFGADAVVFSVVDVWKKKGFGIETKIRYLVKSTTTNEVIFERSCDLYLDLSTQNQNNSAIGALAALAASAINTAVTDHIVAARKCNSFIFKDIPRGKYHPNHMQDQTTAAEPKNVKKTVK